MQNVYKRLTAIVSVMLVAALFTACNGLFVDDDVSYDAGTGEPTATALASYLKFD